MWRADQLLENLQMIYRSSQKRDASFDWEGQMNEEELNSRRRVSNEGTTTKVVLEKGIAVYHGTCFRDQMSSIKDYMRPYDVPDLKFLTEINKGNSTPFIAGKEFFVSNRQTAKIYGSLSKYGTSNSYQFVKMVHSQPYVLYDEMYPPCCDLEFQLKKNVHLLDLSDTKTVKTLYTFSTNDKSKAAFMEAFVVNEENVIRDSRGSNDSVALEFLREYARVDKERIDGYYFCCKGLHEEVCLFDPNATLMFTKGSVPQAPSSQRTRQEFFEDNFFPVYEPAKHGPCQPRLQSPIDVSKETMFVEAGEYIFKSQQQYFPKEANFFDFIHSLQRCVTYQHIVDQGGSTGTGKELVLYATNPSDAYRVRERLKLFSISTDSDMHQHTTSPLDDDQLYHKLIIEYEVDEIFLEDEREPQKKRIPNLKNVTPALMEELCVRNNVDGIFIRGNNVELRYSKEPHKQAMSKDSLYLSKNALRKIQKETIKMPSVEDFMKRFKTSRMTAPSEHRIMLFNKYNLDEDFEWLNWKERASEM
jgi:hypothetical protein